MTVLQDVTFPENRSSLGMKGIPERVTVVYDRDYVVEKIGRSLSEVLASCYLGDFVQLMNEVWLWKHPKEGDRDPVGSFLSRSGGSEQLPLTSATSSREVREVNGSQHFPAYTSTSATSH